MVTIYIIYFIYHMYHFPILLVLCSSERYINSQIITIYILQFQYSDDDVHWYVIYTNTNNFFTLSLL